MKTIGIVGGIAWPSSIVYYRLINEMVSERLGDGGLHSARLVLAEADFDEIERCQREDRWDCVGEILAAEGEKLRLAGAHFFLLACKPFTLPPGRLRAPSTCRSFTSSTRPPRGPWHRCI